MSRSRENDSDDSSNRLVRLVIIMPLIVLVTKLFWPEVIPFEVFAFWNMRGTSETWIAACWPVIAWGVGVNIVYHLFREEETGLVKRVMYRLSGVTASRILIHGFKQSLLAGFFEELLYRWIFFLGMIVTGKVVNFLFFGFLGFGIPEWVHLNLLGPLADWSTLNALHSSLFHASGWAVGAAVLGASAAFRSGHAYQGVFGWINSWFMGMFLFWVTFRFGLPIAMAVHFTYDFAIFIVSAIAFKLRQG